VPRRLQDALAAQVPDATAGSDDLLLSGRNGGAHGLDLAGDFPTVPEGIHHAIGTDKYPAPQGTLMATLIKGILSFNLDWQFVIVGAAIALVMELCGIKALSFAIGIYLPLSTTLPIFIGGAIRGVAEWVGKKKGEVKSEEDDLGKGNLFATGLVAGGAVAGVVVAFLLASEPVGRLLANVNSEHGLTNLVGGETMYFLLGVLFFAIMGYTLYRVARSKVTEPIITDI